ncbi:hypothetical protein FQR65_LT15767 [Abscondita terminalis]|nr:hypothetical protein FQR65_LT15767 [Abscondita terminalis]
MTNERIEKKGLYDPDFEHDACGVGFVAHIKGRKSHNQVKDALTMLENMEHRGACGCDPESGDGAGIMIQLPHEFLWEECISLGIQLEEPGYYGTGMLFLPKEAEMNTLCRSTVVEACEERNMRFLGFRTVPVNREGIGPTALSAEPEIVQFFVARPEGVFNTEEFERKLFVMRRWVSSARFGYSREDLETILAPMALTDTKPIGSMGTDVPLAVLSDQPQHLSSYFKQFFAQVTNPPIDPIRERLVMSLATFIGNAGNILIEDKKFCHCVTLQHPILTSSELEKLRSIDTGVFQAKTLQLYFKADGKPGHWKMAWKDFAVMQMMPAMSLGSISTEAHSTLAIAMNRIGAKSNTGEGGEDASRFIPLANGQILCDSAIMQVASARFGVTRHIA